MRLLVGSALLGSALLGSAACSKGQAPTAPAEAAPARIAPMHDGIPATFAGHPEGPVVWLCATELRAYLGSDGRTHWDEDHYLQYDTCPAVPIK